MEPDIYDYLNQLADDLEEDYYEEEAQEYDNDLEDILIQIQKEN